MDVTPANISSGNSLNIEMNAVEVMICILWQ